MSRSVLTWVYLGLVALGAVAALLAWSVMWRGPLFPSLQSPIASSGSAFLLVLLAILAQHFPVMIAPSRKVDTSMAVYFAFLLLFGAPAAVGLVGLSQLVGQGTLALRRNPTTGRRRRTPRSALFNTSQLMVATALGGLVYFSALPHVAPASLDQVENLWVLPAAALTVYLTNTLAVAGMVAIQSGRSLFAVWRPGKRRLPTLVGYS